MNRKVNFIINLKPCPFCGGEAKVYEAPVNRENKIPCYGVSCTRCKTMIGTVTNGQTDFFRTAFDAVVAWNRRAPREE